MRSAGLRPLSALGSAYWAREIGFRSREVDSERRCHSLYSGQKGAEAS